MDGHQGSKTGPQLKGCGLCLLAWLWRMIERLFFGQKP